MSLASYWRQYVGQWPHYVECGFNPGLLANLLAKRRFWGSDGLKIQEIPMIYYGGEGRNRTDDEAFAEPCLTTWLPRHGELID